MLWKVLVGFYLFTLSANVKTLFVQFNICSYPICREPGSQGGARGNRGNRQQAKAKRGRQAGGQLET